MLIDFHIHAFTDSIAKRAMDSLKSVGDMNAYTDGTVSDTSEKLSAWQVDRGILLPIATKPSQQTTINNWAAEVQTSQERIISFGSIHPDAPDAMDELERIHVLGLKGVKFHPDYQNYFIDDEKAFPLYEKCAKLGLPAIFHAGFDPVSPAVCHALPEASRRVLDAVPDFVMVLAHMGGMYRWDEVEEYLVGQNVYFDTAYVAEEISDEQAFRIIKNHGADKILFASDCPWSDSPRQLEMINRLPLTGEEREAILWKNAAKLLRLPL